MNNKGFTLLELLISVCIISAISILTLTSIDDIDLTYLYFMNDYIEGHAKSITNNERVNLDNFSISFNEQGHVNRGQTINISNHEIIIHLGNGYLTYE